MPRCGLGPASGDSGEEREDVARRERRIESFAVMHKSVIDEQVYVAAHRTRLIADALVQCGVAPLELLQRGTHGRGRKNKLRRGVVAIGTQRRGDLDRDGHGAARRRIGVPNSMLR